jgi:hypothetical protein
MSTSSAGDTLRMEGPGFTALELLVGMSLAVLMMLGVAPLVTSLQAGGTREVDRTVVTLQGRVAVARLERDLRMATALGSYFGVDGAVLEATQRQVVFLGRTGGGSGLCLIEWEVVGATIMRRWGPCPARRPISFAHSAYVDNKSMLEGLAGDACFSYIVNGSMRAGALPESELAGVQYVVLRGSGHDMRGEWPSAIRATARVGI